MEKEAFMFAMPPPLLQLPHIEIGKEIVKKIPEHILTHGAGSLDQKRMG
jgi:hypothetical protein